MVHLASSFASMIAVLVMLGFLVWSGDREYSSWLSLLAVVLLLQFVLLKDGLHSAGFLPGKKSFRTCSVLLVSIVLVLGVILVATGLSGFSPDKKFELNFKKAGIYFSCVLFQQYIFSSFLLNRLVDYYESVKNKNLIFTAAGVFSFAHAPNFFLMIVTFCLGLFCATNFLRHRNIYFLVAIHLILGIFINYLVPDSITRGMVIGPAYFNRL